ncbi:MAG: hypothetical protein WCP66_01760 [Methylococcales bacterium]
MTVVNYYLQEDMSTPFYYNGSLTGQTATSISFSDGVHSGTYTGSFNYSSLAALNNSIITGYKGYINREFNS